MNLLNLNHPHFITYITVWCIIQPTNQFSTFHYKITDSQNATFPKSTVSILPNSTMSSPEGLLSPEGSQVLDRIALQNLPTLPPSNSYGNISTINNNEQQLSSSSLLSTDSPISSLKSLYHILKMT